MASGHGMQKLDFFKLPRDKQERFLASAKGSAPPAPIVQLRGDGGKARNGAIAAGVSVLLLLVLFVIGFGVLGGKLAVQGPAWLAAYFVLAFLVPYGVLRVLGSRSERKTLPYQPGIYVFPMCLVDARTKDLRVVPMANLSRVENATAGGALRLSFKGAGTYAFPAGDKHDADQKNYQIDLAQKQVKHATQNQDDAELTTLDPFYESRKSWTSPIGPKQALVDRAPITKRFDWAFALVIAVVLAPTLWLTRNTLSDNSMLRKATAANTPDAYRAYLDVGKKHTGEVSGVLLPRAELADAKAKGTVEAISDFIASHPKSAIDAEAQAALHDALVTELDKAAKKGSLAALEAFARKYPDSHLQAQIAKDRHALYDAALARFRKQASTRDTPELVDFARRLCAYLEAHGTAITVALHREVSPAVAQADKLIGRAPTNRRFGPHQVTQYLETDPKQADDAAAVKNAVASALAPIFAPDLATFTVVPEADDAAAAALAAKTPLLRVSYRFGWLGVAYGSASLKRAFAGIHTSGEAVFSLPGDAKPLRMKLEVPSPRTLLLEYSSVHPGLSSEGPPDEDKPEPRVYRATELHALDRITTTVVTSLVRPLK